jgi:hypothetical protein
MNRSLQISQIPTHPISPLLQILFQAHTTTVSCKKKKKKKTKSSLEQLILQEGKKRLERQPPSRNGASQAINGELEQS